MIFRRSGCQRGESGSAATAVAPAPDGAGAHTDHEPAASGGAQRSGPADSDDSRAHAGHRTGSGEQSRGATIANASRGGATDGAGLRTDPGESGSVSVWQADRELSGAGAARGLEWEAATAGPYHETRELSDAVLVSGSSASHGA